MFKNTQIVLLTSKSLMDFWKRETFSNETKSNHPSLRPRACEALARKLSKSEAHFVTPKHSECLQMFNQCRHLG